jgi:hypothetical protein
MSAHEAYFLQPLPRGAFAQSSSSALYNALSSVHSPSHACNPGEGRVTLPPCDLRSVFTNRASVYVVAPRAPSSAASSSGSASATTLPPASPASTRSPPAAAVDVSAEQRALVGSPSALLRALAPLSGPAALATASRLDELLAAVAVETAAVLARAAAAAPPPPGEPPQAAPAPPPPPPFQSPPRAPPLPASPAPTPAPARAPAPPSSPPAPAATVSGGGVSAVEFAELKAEVAALRERVAALLAAQGGAPAAV